jgi:hypothetical protein
MRRLAPVVVAVALLISCAGAPAAIGQDPVTTVPEAEQVIDPDAVVDPDSEAERGTNPDLPAEEAPDEGDVLLPEEKRDDDGNTSNRQIQTPGYGSAADQLPEAKRAEIRSVENSCKTNAPPPTSTMLGLPGVIGGDDENTVGWYLIAGAVGALLVAAAAFAVKHRGKGDGAMGSLSNAATLIGIVAAVTGLAVQFVPGLRLAEPPPPEATMEVGQVHPRITREEYARKTNSDFHLKPLDRREVGNVIWVEVELKGYKDKHPSLQYALYDSDAAGALLPGTAKRIPLNAQGKDVETLFVPIWVGYPKSNHFQAQFRLLEGEQVQQMASTGKMRGSDYRYTCLESV